MEQFTIAQRVLIVKTFIRTDRLISRNDDHQWSPKSCDFTLDFFLRVFLMAYVNKPRKIRDLKDEIRRAVMQSA